MQVTPVGVGARCLGEAEIATLNRKGEICLSPKVCR
jgi:hypothetical protein